MKRIWMSGTMAMLMLLPWTHAQEGASAAATLWPAADGGNIAEPDRVMANQIAAIEKKVDDLQSALGIPRGVRPRQTVDRRLNDLETALQKLERRVMELERNVKRLESKK